MHSDERIETEKINWEVPMKEVAFCLNLKDQPDRLRECREWQARVSPEITREIASCGVISQKIYLAEDRLFMVLQVEDGFDDRTDFASVLERTQEAADWGGLTEGLRQGAPLPRENDVWVPVEPVYNLNAAQVDNGGDPQPLQTVGPILDTHQHFWKVDRGDYFWLSPESDILYRDFLPGDLEPLLRQAGVTRTILVQAADTEAETDFLLDIAERCEFVAGVCGWLDMDSDGFPRRLDHYRSNPLFLSFRPMLQDLEENDWILKPRVLENLAYVASVGMRFEILTKPPQLPYAVEAIRRTPGLRAVMNHLSKPLIAEGRLEPWAIQIAELRDFPDVYCKISGMVTEADHLNWTPEDLRPYITHVLDVFGTDRVMFGSDWPVALLAASSYGDVVNALRSVIGPQLGRDGHRKLFRDNGVRFYGI